MTREELKKKWAEDRTQYKANVEENQPVNHKNDEFDYNDAVQQNASGNFSALGKGTGMLMNKFREKFASIWNKQDTKTPLAKDVGAMNYYVTEKRRNTGQVNQTTAVNQMYENRINAGKEEETEEEKKLPEAKIDKKAVTQSSLATTAQNYREFKSQVENEKGKDTQNYGYAEKFNGENGNIDINHREVLKNSDGSISTEQSITITTNEDGKEKYVVIPTVIDGILVPNDKAVEHYEETGENLGKFDSEQDSEKYAEYLHERQEQFYKQEGDEYYKEWAEENGVTDTLSPVDWGKLKDGASIRNFVEAGSATFLDIAKQATKGFETDPADHVNDIMLIAQAKILESKGMTEQADELYQTAMRDTSEEFVNAVGAGIDSAVSSRNYEQSVQYMQNLEDPSMLTRMGEGMVQSTASNIRKSLTQEALPWQVQTAAEIAPESYLEGREKGYSDAKNLVNVASDIAIEIGTEYLGGGFGLKGTGGGSGKFANISNAKIRAIRSYIDTASDEGKEEVIGGFLGTVKDYFLDNGIDEMSAEGLANELAEYAIGGDAMRDYMSGALSVGLGDIATGGRTYQSQKAVQQRNQRVIDMNITQEDKQARIGFLDRIYESDMTSFQKDEMAKSVYNGTLSLKKGSSAEALDTMIEKEEKRANELKDISKSIEDKVMDSDLKDYQKFAILSDVDLLSDKNITKEGELDKIESQIKKYQSDNKKVDNRNQKRFNQIMNGETTIDSLIEKSNLTRDQKDYLVELTKDNNYNLKDVIERFNNFKTMNKQIRANNRELRSLQEADTQKQLPTMENKPLLETEQQTNLPEAQEAQTPMSNEITKTGVTFSKKGYETPAKEGTIRLYTNTNGENLESILKEGLKTSKAQQKEYEGNMTWFETTPDLKGYGGTTIAVDVPINTKMQKVNDSQYTVFEDVTPENIVFIDKPVFSNYRTSDIAELVEKYGKDRVIEVFNTAKQKYVSQEEFNNIINQVDSLNNVDTGTEVESAIIAEDNNGGAYKLNGLDKAYSRILNNNSISNEAKKSLLQDLGMIKTQKDLDDFNQALSGIEENPKLPQAETLPEASTTVNENAQTQPNGVVARADNNSTEAFTQDFQQDMEENLYAEEETVEEPEEKDTRVYSHYKRGIESDFINEEAQEKMKKVIRTPNGRYEVIHNAPKITESEDKISKYGIDNIYEDFCNKFDDGKEMTLDDIYDCEVMIQQYAYEGNTEKVMELMARQAVLGKTLGQRIQAMSIITRGTPQGKLAYMQKSLQRYNSENGTNIKIDQKLADELLKSKTDKETEKNIDKIYKQIGKEMPATMWESLDEWRFFSMLFNPSTHIRNLGGNFGMHQMQAIKNEINGAMQDVYKKINPNFEQTVSLIRRPTKKIRDFADKDLALIGDVDTFGSKYKEDFNREVEKYKKKLLPGFDQASKFNANLLDKEDKFFLNWEYKKSLARYISANNLDVDNDLRTLREDTKEDTTRKKKNLEKARKWAVKEALEATFHQKSKLASELNRLERMALESDNGFVELAGVGLKLTLDSKIPFKRTPINIAKTAGAYSPLGLVTSLGGTLADIGVRNKKINKRYANEFNNLQGKKNSGRITQERYNTLMNDLIEKRNQELSDVINKRFDKIAKGTTGTALMAIGAFLASNGILALKGGNDDDEDDYISEMTGSQEYSISIGDVNIPIDWLAPGTIPIIAGANAVQRFTDGADLETLERLASTATASASSVVDPIFELSFLEGLSNAFNAYSNNKDQSGSEVVGAMVSTIALDYISQTIPTIFGRINRVIDPTVRDTTTTKTGVIGEAQRTLNQAKSKLWSRSLPAKYDRWGEEISRNDTPAVELTSFLFGDNEFGKGVGRLLDAISPTTINKVEELDKTEKELLKIAKSTNEKVLPTQKKLDKTFKLNGESYRYDDEEYNKAKQIRGEEAKKMLDAFVSSKDYNKLSEPEKAKIMQNIYLYGTQRAIEDYSEKHNIDFKTIENDSEEMFNTVDAIKEAGGTEKDYFNFVTGTAEMRKNRDKAGIINYVENMNVNDKVKNAIYENDISKTEFMMSTEDTAYNNLKAITGNKVGSGYMEYKKKSAEGYFTNKDEKTGKEVEGQKRARLIQVLQDSDLSNIEMYYIMAKEGYAVSKDNGGLNQSQRDKLRNALENNKSNLDEQTYNTMIKTLNEADAKAKKWGVD